MTTLVLFDIDATILNTRGAGSRAIVYALETVFYRKVDTDGYRMSGKTDSQICIELMAGRGVSQDKILPRFPDIWKYYVAELRRGLSDGLAFTYPGIRELLERLDTSPDVLLGLLTGNIRAGARAKLEAVNLFHFFKMGAFGDDAIDRVDLPAIAVRRAAEDFGLYVSSKAIVIIGDTPNDILCGRHLGVKTIAVATGSYTMDQLAAYTPDRLFESLADTDKVFDAIVK